jgi:hypothetical protein
LNFKWRKSNGISPPAAKNQIQRVRLVSGEKAAAAIAFGGWMGVQSHEAEQTS